MHYRYHDRIGWPAFGVRVRTFPYSDSVTPYGTLLKLNEHLVGVETIINRKIVFWKSIVVREYIFQLGR